MNRHLTLSAILHAALLGGLAIWGGFAVERAAPEISRVRIIDERAGAAAEASAERLDARPGGAAPERRLASAPLPPSRTAEHAPGRIPPPPAAPRERTTPLPPDQPAPAGPAGSGSVVPGPAPAGDADGGGAAAERDDRIAEIHARIQAALLYPREARRRGVEGTVQLRFDLGEDGRVRRVAVRESSGERLLDRASIETVRRAQPFPFVAGELEVPVVFRLK